MSELTQVAENILSAMDALKDAHKAGETLREDANHEALNAFRQKMRELQERLFELKTVLDDEEAYAMDELVEALSHAYSNKPVKYRKTHHLTA